MTHTAVVKLSTFGLVTELNHVTTYSILQVTVYVIDHLTTSDTDHVTAANMYSETCFSIYHVAEPDVYHGTAPMYTTCSVLIYHFPTFSRTSDSSGLFVSSVNSACFVHSW